MLSVAFGLTMFGLFLIITGFGGNSILSEVKSVFNG